MNCPFDHAGHAQASDNAIPGRTGISRRGFLGGVAGSFAAGTALTGASAVSADTEDSAKNSGVLPFEGAHQQGIMTPLQKYSVHVALDLVVVGQEQLEQLFRILTREARKLCAGGVIAPDNVGLPANDSGELGPVLATDNLSITVAVGESLFDERFGLSKVKPTHLSTMTPFADDTLVEKYCHGDLMVQICADQRDTVLHALRTIMRNLRGFAVIKWRQSGYQNEPRPTGTPRNHLGFKDGIINPKPEQASELVWVTNDEPAWAKNGSYMVVRLITMYTEFWDRISIAEQEQIFGRDRITGGPLSGGDEWALPKYSNDPGGDVIPTDAHIRLANPRTKETDNQLMLRRAYNYDNGIQDNGTLDMGLVFVCFQQDLDRQFITVQKRLEGEPLADYIRPYGGGYYFALPGVQGADDYLGKTLLAATL